MFSEYRLVEKKGAVHFVKKNTSANMKENK